MMNLKMFNPKEWFMAIGDRKLGLQEHNHIALLI